ncbi:hypothetical protein [Shimia sediminis]|uniref:hypothetical protein n=1 Tax=Shimia sediminis TaxID=2497945 RepID=UPI000F8E5B2A|nr:hypothetical protein [Shimia sediminis]
MLEQLCKHAIRLLGLGPVCQLFAAQPRPIVQRIEVIKVRFGHKQPAAQKSDLVLNLSLLPAHSQGAGNRLHLLRFAGIGHDKGLAAVAQVEMGNLHLLLETAQYCPFFASVKLQCIACRKMQQDKSLARTGTGPLLGAPPFPAGSLLVLIEKPLKSKIKTVARPVPNQWHLALVAQRPLILQILVDRFPRLTGCCAPRPIPIAGSLTRLPSITSPLFSAQSCADVTGI